LLFAVVFSSCISGAISSISQVIGCEDRPRNDLGCVGRAVKVYSNSNDAGSLRMTLSMHIQTDFSDSYERTLRFIYFDR